MTIINLFEKTCNKGGFYGGCYKKAGLSGLDDKKRLRAKRAPNPF
ncbi:hypothetical protein [Helicobacter pylori]|nr:hypothetical protein [Helicobacter pylori]